MSIAGQKKSAIPEYISRLRKNYFRKRYKGDVSMYPYPSDTEINHLGEFDSDDFKASSGTDCTGLIPTAVTSDAELENYNELYDFLPNAVSDGKNDGC